MAPQQNRPRTLRIQYSLRTTFAVVLQLSVTLAMVSWFGPRGVAVSVLACLCSALAIWATSAPTRLFLRGPTAVIAGAIGSMYGATSLQYAGPLPPIVLAGAMHGILLTTLYTVFFPSPVATERIWRMCLGAMALILIGVIMGAAFAGVAVGLGNRGVGAAIYLLVVGVGAGVLVSLPQWIWCIQALIARRAAEDV